MSEIENDAKKAAADAKNAVTNVRRRVAARLLDWLKNHPRGLIVIVAALTILAVMLGLARG